MKELDNVDFTYEIIKELEDLKNDIPEFITHFSEISKAALTEGAIDKKTKSLIALSLSIILNSKKCTEFHLQNSISLGANYKELLEILSLVTYMGGGPALMSAEYALKTYHKIKK